MYDAWKIEKILLDETDRVDLALQFGELAQYIREAWVEKDDLGPFKGRWFLDIVMGNGPIWSTLVCVPDALHIKGMEFVMPSPSRSSEEDGHEQLHIEYVRREDAG